MHHTDLGGKAPHQKLPDNQEKLLADAAKKAVLETLKKQYPTLAQIDQVPITSPDPSKSQDKPKLPVPTSAKQVEVNNQILQIFSRFRSGEEQTFIPSVEFQKGSKLITADYPETTKALMVYTTGF